MAMADGWWGTWTPSRTFDGLGQWPTALCWSPDGSFLVAGDRGGEISVWDVASGARIYHIDRRSYDVRDPVYVDSLRWLPDGSDRLRQAGRYMWQLHLSSSRRPTQMNLGEPGHVVWSPDGSRFVRAHRNLDAGYVWGATAPWEPSSNWDADPQVELRRPDGASLSWIWPVQGPPTEWSPDGSRIAITGQDGALRVWDSASGECVLEVYLRSRMFGDDRPPLSRAAWSPDGSRIAITDNPRTAGEWGMFAVFDAVSGARLQEVALKCDFNQQAFRAEWSPNGSRIALSDDEVLVKVFDASSNQCLHWLKHPLSAYEGPEVDSVVWSPDGSRLASRDRTGSAFVWDAISGVLLQILPGVKNTPVCWSPDGSFLAVGRLGKRRPLGAVDVWFVPR